MSSLRCASWLGCWWLALASVAGAQSTGAPSSTAQSSGVETRRGSSPPPPPDVVLVWNLTMLDANAADHALASPDQGGPTKTSRAFAIVSAAMFDAWNSIHHRYRPYLTDLAGYESADERSAVAAAAYQTLRALYPQQRNALAAAYADWLRRIPSGTYRAQGVQLGERVATAILAHRAGDGSDATMTYVPGIGPGFHQVDPLHPNQGFLAPQWGYVRPFVIGNVASYISPPPPALDSPAYAAAYRQVQRLGGDGVTTPTERTREQTTIGMFWGYDGAPRLGTPPRMYNQIARVIAQDRRNTVEQNARLFALVNLAQADAGVQSWFTKYEYEFWRPVIALRNGDRDGNPRTEGDPNWRPFGAPATNGAGDGVNFTPPFPAYTSGHATFGAAAMWSIARFYGTSRIDFRFTSDEFNGLNRNGDGSLRPIVTRRYRTLDEAIAENAISRIYLGIHWSFDADQGVTSGKRIANEIADRALQPVRGRR